MTHDVSIGLRTPWKQAEEIKRNHGCAVCALVGKEEAIEVPGLAGRPSYHVPRGELAAIIEARMEEIFTLVHREIRRTDYAELLAAGVVITGGGAMLEGCAELAEEVFGMPVSLGTPKGVTGLADAVSQPLYATGVGLVLFGLHHQNRKFLSDDGDFFESILGRMKNWVRNFF